MKAIFFLLLIPTLTFSQARLITLGGGGSGSGSGIDSSLAATKFGVDTAKKELRNAMELKASKNQANGYAGLNGSAKVDTAYLPAQNLGALNTQWLKTLDNYGPGKVLGVKTDTTEAVPFEWVISGTPLTQLSPPDSFNATAISSEQINATWVDVANESSYETQYSLNGSSWSAAGTPAENATSYNFTSLMPSTLYYLRCRAVGDGTTYSNSSWVSDTATTQSSNYDTDALAVITAIEGTGATLTSTQKFACDRLVRDLKGEANGSYTTYNIWDKITVLYGILGGTAAAHKFNWKNPIDTDGAYRMTFPNGATHSSNGISWNGSTQYGNTHVILDNTYNHNSHLAFFNKSANTTSGVDLGVYNVDQKFYLYLSGGFIGGRIGWTAPEDTEKSVATTPMTGFVIAETDGSNVSFHQNGTSLGTFSRASSTSTSTLKIYAAALNNGGSATSFSNATQTLISIGRRITGAEAVAYNNAVQAYQTTLTR